MKEVRVYVVHNGEIAEELNCEDARELTNEEFQAEAERQGTVFTLEGFEYAINFSELYVDESYIRFITVTI